MTFSICFKDETESGPVFGGGAATYAPAVGATTPVVSRHGVVNTQGLINVRLAEKGVRLLSELSVEVALRGLLEQDEYSAIRQVHGIDHRGGAYAFTGSRCKDWSGHYIDESKEVTVAGNLLADGSALEAAVEALEDREKDPAKRLIDALAAARDTGGDHRGHRSATISVWSPTPRGGQDLRVDYHEQPIEELRRVYQTASAYSDQFFEEDYEKAELRSETPGI